MVSQAAQQTSLGSANGYDNWLKNEGVPVHKGYYVEDVRTLELAR